MIMLSLAQSMDCLRKVWIHGSRRAIRGLSRIHCLRTTYTLYCVFQEKYSNTILRPKTYIATCTTDITVDHSGISTHSSVLKCNSKMHAQYKRLLEVTCDILLLYTCEAESSHKYIVQIAQPQIWCPNRSDKQTAQIRSDKLPKL